ncbi:serine/threonine-protein kinase [Jatrophihabitans fulvus]
MPDEPADAPDDATQHFPAPSQPQTGWVIGGRYRVTGRLGSGGMADVVRAHDESLDRDVAVKVFRTAAAADTAAGIERQRAELHALARLNHPNLITLYDGSLGEPGTGERAYLVMELVEGPNLGDRIDRGPLPSEPETRVVGAQIADAMAYVHAQGMVHRDIKPANILLGAGTGPDEVRARLSDFGIVRLLGAERLTQADSTLGTASYLAPEQARGSGVGPAADIYAFGLTLIEALTGIRSFDGPTPLEAVVARLDRDPEIPPNLPAPWPGLLRAMTARDPDARPTAQQVASALRAGTAGFAVPPPVAPASATAGTTVIPSVAPAAAAVAAAGVPPSRVSERLPVHEEPRRRNAGLVVGALLVLVLLALGAVILIATTGGDDGPGDTADPSTTTSQTSRSTRAPSSERTTSRESRTRTRSSSQSSTERSTSSSESRSNPQPPPQTESSSEQTSSSATENSSSSSSSSSASSASSASSSSSPQAAAPESSSSDPASTAPTQ